MGYDCLIKKKKLKNNDSFAVLLTAAMNKYTLITVFCKLSFACNIMANVPWLTDLMKS